MKTPGGMRPRLDRRTALLGAVASAGIAAKPARAQSLSRLGASAAGGDDRRSPEPKRKRTRQTLHGPDALTAEQRRVYDEVTKIRPALPDGTLGGPFDAWLLNPQMMLGLTRLLPVLWDGTSIGRGLSEVAILITGKIWRCNVAWAMHAPHALDAGIPQRALDDILAGRRPTNPPEVRLAYDLLMSMHMTKAISAALYQRGVDRFGERGVEELMAVSGFYCLAAMTLNRFEVQVAPGLPSPFARDA